MPINVVGRLSADANNALQAGTDGGLYQASPARGASNAYVVDNSWSGVNGATYYYPPSNGLLGNYQAFAANTASLFPVVFTANCVIAQAPLCVKTAAANSKMYLSLFASNATNGFPSTKLADLFLYATTVAGVITPTVVTACPTLTANTVYWACMWASSTVVQFYTRYPQFALPGIRSTTGAYGLAIGTALGAYADTTVSWASTTTAPASLTAVNADGANASANAMPLVYWGLTNV